MTSKDLLRIFFTDILRNWVQIPKENVRKNAWKKQYAVLTNHRFLLYNSDRDQHAMISIDLSKLIHVRAVNQRKKISIPRHSSEKIPVVLHSSRCTP